MTLVAIPERRRLGPADRVTLVRAVLSLMVAFLVWYAAESALLVTLASVALALDLLDGVVARRTGTVSEFGARFDLEVDAFLILVLSVHVGRSLGWWVLLIGAARYLLWAAQALVPWLRGQVAPRRWRKVVAAYQGVALTVVSAELLPRGVAVGVVLVGLVALAVSFGTEAWTLARARAHARQLPPRVGTDPRRVGTISVLAALLVWVALVAPELPGSVVPVAFLRLPVEGLVLVGVALALGSRPRLRRWVLWGVGVALALLLLVRLLDQGFRKGFFRRFNLVSDWRYSGSGLDLLTDTLGRPVAVVAAVAVVLLVVGLVVGLPLALMRLAGVVDRHRREFARGAGALAVVWVILALVGVAWRPGVPVASRSTAALASEQVVKAVHDVRDQGVFAAQIADDPVSRGGTGAGAGAGGEAGTGLLPGLRGQDVMVVFVESYGRVAAQGSPVVTDALADGTSRLAAQGFSARSGWLTSPTFGGISWLAHSSLQSGLWVDSQQRYDQLLDSDRLTLTRAFQAGGWRTVSVAPANHRDWPEGLAFYGYDAELNAANLGYRGPAFGYAPMPDQFTLAAFDRLELSRPNRGPVMAEIDLVSSHVPWVPTPHIVDWASIGDGSGYHAQKAGSAAYQVVGRSPSAVRADYERSVVYSLESVVTFLENSAGRDPVVVLLGDHQPSAVVPGATASHDVPVSVISRDPAVLDRVAGWGWDDGLQPRPDGPVWLMDEFRNRFLEAFGPAR